MELAQAINMLLTLTQAATNAAASMGQVSAIIQRAAAEGRTTLNPDEESTVKAMDDSARAALAAEIQRRLTA